MSKIKILAIPPDTHGVGKYRILDPFKFIGDNFLSEVHVDFNFNVPEDDDFFKDYNIVVFHSFIHQTTHESNVDRIKWLRSKGIITIMDIDDYWLPDQKHPMYRTIVAEKFPERKIEMLKEVDYVTTTTSIFAQTIKTKLNLKNVFVFPNAVNDEEPQFKPNPIKSDKVRFGWLGGSSHLHDIELMVDGISSIHDNYKDKVQFVLCGFDLRGKITEINKDTGERKTRDIRPTESVWYKYEQMFTKNYSVLDSTYKNFLLTFDRNIPDVFNNQNYIRRWTEEISSYAKNYNYFDVSLAPLFENHFNRNKSELKVIEAGFHKKAIIASEVEPYTLDLINGFDNGNFNSKGNALLVSTRRNHKDWGKHMKKLVENPNLIEDLGNRLYETVKDKFSLRKVCNDRVQFFKSIINN